MLNPASHAVQQTVFGLVVRTRQGNGRYIGAYTALPAPLSREDERKALLRMHEGDIKMRNILIEHNLRLVVYIARKFTNTGFDMEDLISIGTIGLIKAVNSFKIERNIKLATYASRCVENEILMALRQASRSKWEISFDVPIYSDGDGNEIRLSDILATDANLVSRDLDDIEYRRMLYAAIRKLHVRDRKIVELRFGLNSGLSHTQSEVARMLGMSQSYISRLEKKICKQLKAHLLS